jgi:hypothetical protein
MPIAVIYAAAAMLLLGAATLPYGYYMLLRLVACGVFSFAAFIAFDRKHKVLPWVIVRLRSSRCLLLGLLASESSDCPFQQASKNNLYSLYTKQACPRA